MRLIYSYYAFYWVISYNRFYIVYNHNHYNIVQPMFKTFYDYTFDLMFRASPFAISPLHHWVVGV